MQHLTNRLFIAALLVAAMSGCGKKERDAAVQTESVPLSELGRLSTPEGRRAEAERAKALSGATSSWETERLAARAGSQLSRLGEYLSRAGELPDIFGEGFVGKAARPELATVFKNGAVEVREPRDAFGGELGVGDCFASLREAAEGCDTLFKVISVEPDEAAGTVAMDVLFEAFEAGRRQIGGRWSTVWQRGEGDGLTLISLEPEIYREAVGASEGAWLVDSTGSVAGGVAAVREQLAYGLDHWLRRIERVHGMLYFKRHGLAVGDADGDGLDDVYVCQAGGLPNRLLLQNTDGTVRDVSKASGVDILDNTSAALLVDLDNDGDQDISLATFEGVVLLENKGGAKFERRAVLPTLDTDLMGLSAVDFDLDGDLDLYVLADFAEHGRRPGETAQGFVYHDANEGGANVLFRNDSAGGNWVFRDATEESGLGVHNRRHSLAAAWEDYDADGDQDLYVANDYGQNCLYRNEAGRFVETANEVGLVDFGSGMSASWGDFDRDGRADLYVGNMFSSAGRRITPQAAFLGGADAEKRRLYNRFAKGNSLFRGVGDNFSEVPDAGGAERGRWAWSSPFADIDNDGFEDLLVANGYITASDPGDL